MHTLLVRKRSPPGGLRREIVALVGLEPTFAVYETAAFATRRQSVVAEVGFEPTIDGYEPSSLDL